MFKLKNEKQPLGGVISDSFHLVGHSWAANIVIVLVAIIGSLALLFVFGSSAIVHFAKIIVSMQTLPHGKTVQIAAILPSTAVIVSFLLGLFLSAWFSLICKAILVRSCWNVALTGHPQLKNAFSVGFKYFYVYFFQLLAIIAVIVAAHVIQFLFSFLNQHWLDSVVAIVTQLFVYYIIVKLMLVDVASVIEECGFRGFSYSWRYVSGNWWRTLGSSVFSYIFYSIFLMFIGIGIIMLVLTPGVQPVYANGISHFMTHAHFQDPVWFGVITIVFTLVTFIALILTVPTLVAANHAVLYQDLKQRHQG